ncbi:MAG: bacteriophage abortive infection AbiH family protein [Spirochaetales bacterium]|nr:bacteriophage abortive infection AbiH family protein [Spirochaetales bacterium]
MNRLIIIGNGFDIAHGLKTKYSEMLEHYLSALHSKLSSSGKYSDSFIEISHWLECPADYESFKEQFLNNTIDSNSKDFNGEKRILIIDSQGRRKYFRQRKFMFNLLKDHCQKWVDVENTYMKLIIENGNTKKEIEEINKDFEIFRKLMISYLKKQDEEIVVNDDIMKIFDSDKSYNNMILDFNYTGTSEKYAKRLNEVDENNQEKQRFETIKIHGNLYDENNPPILGIGDEHNKELVQVSEYDNLNSLFKYNKSVHYLMNDNYKKLLKFLNDNPNIQVEIFGHSCGRSDRTLLKFIFENKNVKRIQVNYHDIKENFLDLIIEVYRHFDDKQMYREKVLDFSKVLRIPQTQKNYTREVCEITS